MSLIEIFVLYPIFLCAHNQMFVFYYGYELKELYVLLWSFWDVVLMYTSIARPMYTYNRYHITETYTQNYVLPLLVYAHNKKIHIFDYKPTKILNIEKYLNKRNISEILHMNITKFTINKKADIDKNCSIIRRYPLQMEINKQEFPKPTTHQQTDNLYL